MYRSTNCFQPVRWLLPVLIMIFCHLNRAVAQEEERVLLEEDFNAYSNTAAMEAVWPGGSGTLVTSGVPGGGKAVLHDGGALNVHTGFTIRPDAKHNVVLSADLYDYGTNADKRVTIMLRNGSGMNLEFGILNEIGAYCARAVGFANFTEWVAFGEYQQPEKGWHRFQAVITMTNVLLTLDLGRDGKIDQRLEFPGPGPSRPLDAIRFGGLPDRTSHGGPVFVDNIRLALVPVTAPAPEPAVAPPGEASAPPASVPSAPLDPVNAPPNPVVWWVASLLVVIILLLFGLLLALLRGGRRPATEAVQVSSPLPRKEPVVAPEEQLSVEEWKRRAIAAENVAGKQAEILRDKIMPELTEFAKQSLVQGLYSQRNELMETQRKAQAELAALEARLSALHLPLQERIRAYELRIAELEKEFETRGEEMHELIKATLSLVRQRLKEEKAKEEFGGRFN